MRKIIFAAFLLVIFSALSYAETGDTLTAQASPQQVTETPKSIFDAIGSLFAPAKTKGTADILAEEEKNKPEIDRSAGSSLPQRLVFFGDLFSTAYCAVSWFTFAQSYSDYNTMYDIVDNTTYENYLNLKAEKENVEINQVTAWVSTGIALGFLGYTLADMLWLHAVFPVEAGYANMDGTHMLAFNYRF
jgi:hypothetical protein